MKPARTLLTISLLLTAAMLFAQSESQWLMKVHIPYDFSVADQSFPPGVYNVYTVTAARIIRITNVDGKHTAIVNTQLNYNGAGSPNSRLVFNQYGSQYFLTQIWSAGEDLSRNLTPNPKAKKLADSGALPRTTTVVALGKAR